MTTPRTVDCRGLLCPQPVLNTRDAIATGPQAVVVLVDNQPARENVSRFLEKNGYSAVAEKQEENVWAIRGELNSRSPDNIESAEKPSDAQGMREGRTLIFLSANTIGHGSDELGARLMANFLATLPEMGSLWRIVLVNSGVKLASQPGKCLDALKKLEAQGVGILVCGTCLEYYHLMEHKQVGETTNMLDIVSSMDLADKVIRP